MLFGLKYAYNRIYTGLAGKGLNVHFFILICQLNTLDNIMVISTNTYVIRYSAIVAPLIYFHLK